MKVKKGGQLMSFKPQASENIGVPSVNGMFLRWPSGRTATAGEFEVGECDCAGQYEINSDANVEVGEEAPRPSQSSSKATAFRAVALRSSVLVTPFENAINSTESQTSNAFAISRRV